MADTIGVQHSVSGATLYALLRDANQAVWNGAAFVTYATADLGNYDLPMTEQGTASRFYAVAFPAVAAGLYNVVAFVRAGGAPAETDTIVGSSEAEWDGTSFVRLGDPAGASLSADIAAVKAQTAAIETDTAEIGAAGAGLTALASQASVNTIDDFLDSEIAAIVLAVGTTLDDLVDDLETRLTAALSAKLIAHAAAVLTFSVTTGSTTTAVNLNTVEGTTPSAVDDFYNGAVMVFTSGALAGQRTSITDYVGATKIATVVALTGAPANGVVGVIV